MKRWWLIANKTGGIVIGTIMVAPWAVAGFAWMWVKMSFMKGQLAFIRYVKWATDIQKATDAELGRGGG